MNRNFKKEFLRKYIYIVGIILGLVLLLLQIIKGITGLKNQFLTLYYPIQMIFSFFFIALAMGLQIISWNLLMNSVGLIIPFSKIFKGYLFSFIPRYVPGTIWGYLGRSEWLLQNYNIPYTLSNFGSILEIIASITANIILIGFYYLYEQNHFSLFFCLFLIVITPIIVGLIIKIMLNNPFLEKFLVRHTSSIIIKSPKLVNWYIATMIFIIHWLLYGLALSYLASSFGLISALNIEKILIMSANYALSWLIGFLIIFAPSGLGFREYALTCLLTVYLGFTIAQASIFSVTTRLITAITELLWLIFAGIWDKILYRSK